MTPLKGDLVGRWHDLRKKEKSLCCRAGKLAATSWMLSILREHLPSSIGMTGMQSRMMDQLMVETDEDAMHRDRLEEKIDGLAADIAGIKKLLKNHSNSR